MNKENLVLKITKELGKVVEANSRVRDKNLADVTEKLKKEVGSVESCFLIRKLMLDEDDLRKTKDNLRQWPAAVTFITRHSEEQLDPAMHDIDYDLFDSYRFRMTINDKVGLCVELCQCGCREFDGGDLEFISAASCKFKWGIVDLTKSKYTDRFKADTEACVGDYMTIDRMLNALRSQCRPIRIKK